jgi:hypothetical protein
VSFTKSSTGAKPKGHDQLLDPVPPGTCEADVTERRGEQADEEGPAVRVDAKIARINGDLPVPC